MPPSQDRNFAENSHFFQSVFEIGRRYKIMNPDKMRSEYGKLMYLLMDSSDSTIQVRAAAKGQLASASLMHRM